MLPSCFFFFFYLLIICSCMQSPTGARSCGRVPCSSRRTARHPCIPNRPRPAGRRHSSGNVSRISEILPARTNPCRGISTTTPDSSIGICKKPLLSLLHQSRSYVAPLHTGYQRDRDLVLYFFLLLVLFLLAFFASIFVHSLVVCLVESEVLRSRPEKEVANAQHSIITIEEFVMQVVVFCGGDSILGFSAHPVREAVKAGVSVAHLEEGDEIP